MIKTVKELIKETLSVSTALFKILIPAIIIVKILQEIGAIKVLSVSLAPLMHLFGLPGEMAIVWTTAIVTNIYGSIAVLIMLTADINLTVAQMTILSSMILICHALPVELALCHKVGAKYYFLGIIRFFGACLNGFILNLAYSSLNILNQPAKIIWTQQKQENNLLDWCINQLNSLFYILLVLFCLLCFMRFLNYIKFTDLMGKILKPLLILMGISPQGASISVFGLLAGITFGSGLLLAEAEKKAVEPRDVVLVLVFLSLCHGIIEDTALMLLIGGHISGILFFRLAFAIIVVSILARLKKFNPEKFSC